ncbi:hypothetical protein AAZV13_01G198100 [Glycine max]
MIPKHSRPIEAPSSDSSCRRRPIHHKPIAVLMPSKTLSTPTLTGSSTKIPLSLARTVHFIFGNAVVVFQKCNLVARKTLSNQNNMATTQG